MRGKLSKMSHITMEVLIVIDVHGESAVDFHGESDLLLVSQVGERQAEQDVSHHHGGTHHH